jgi:maleate isomerase
MPYQTIVEDLLAATGASRVTLRLERPDADFPVLVEALAPGVRPIAGETGIPQRTAALARLMADERRLIVQEDCLSARPAPPQALLDLYGVRAQMLAPIDRGGALAGWISVHETSGPRQWSDGDVAAVERATELVHLELDSAATASRS